MIGTPLLRGKAMKSIIEYDNYRKFLQDLYEERKNLGAFTWREFTKRAGFTSPNFMKMVCDGISGLSKESIDRVAKVAGLTGHETDYFRALVLFNQAKKDVDRRKFYNEMREIAEDHKAKLIGGDAFTFYESWMYSALRELAPAMPGAKPSELAAQCNPQISAKEVRSALAFLVKAGFLQKTGDDEYKQVNKSIKASAEALPLALRSLHKQMMDLAKSAVDNIDKSERNVTGVTVSINRKDYEEIVKDIEALRQKVANLGIARGCGKQVYHLGVQLFPLTKKPDNVNESKKV